MNLDCLHWHVVPHSSCHLKEKYYVVSVPKTRNTVDNLLGSIRSWKTSLLSTKKSTLLSWELQATPAISNRSQSNIIGRHQRKSLIISRWWQWWQLKYFWNFTPKNGQDEPISMRWFQIFFYFHPRTLGKIFPILTSIFFRWVGSTTNHMWVLTTLHMANLG